MPLNLGIVIPGVKVTIIIGGKSVETDGSYVPTPGASTADEYMAYLAALGYTKGSIADRERARLADMANKPLSAPMSIGDWYMQLPTTRRLY